MLDDTSDYEMKRNTANNEEEFKHYIGEITKDAHEEMMGIMEEQVENPGAPFWIEEPGGEKAVEEWKMIVDMMAANVMSVQMGGGTNEEEQLRILGNKCMWDDFVKIKLFQYIKHVNDKKD